MHIAPYDNANAPIVDAGNATVPLNFFNIVRLSKGESFDSTVPGYETCIVPATGTVDVEVGGFRADGIGGRGVDVWDGEPEGVYVPLGATARITCRSDAAEVFVAGALHLDDIVHELALDLPRDARERNEIVRDNDDVIGIDRIGQGKSQRAAGRGPMGAVAVAERVGAGRGDNGDVDLDLAILHRLPNPFLEPFF